ncbi:efflux RND transporter periplasmic adaptor subunit [Bradyrhizobium sp. CNPSo 4010]|uniref:Efflux RND transporter periplasmic adaptor subunit n=1 Tax=Bradyrhizobium agreste TaxID=2751811 RepID=A0ABS0PZM4_9BRAD|nr:efflux RND transporter periplasmic adaptor subunit [Bradyrhizobium agreste]MBH5402616.1 efflux RND transporter periplasmic adaptor subunit [Bradyrhizobium agreste]
MDDVVAAWVAVLCSMIPGVTLASVSAQDGSSGRRPIVSWPQGSDAAERLGLVVDAAVAQNRGVVQQAATEAGPQSQVAQLAYPLAIDERPVGAIALELCENRPPQLRVAMRQLQWGAAWVREQLGLRTLAAKERTLARMMDALDLLAACLEEERFPAACRVCVTELALRHGCERVSLGFVRNGRVRVTSISHTAQFGKHMNLVRLVARTMEEAIDQQSVILHPPVPGDLSVTRAHAALAAAHGCGAVLTAPLYVKDEFVGAFTFERGEDTPFDQDAVEFLECVSSVIGPVLQVKRLEDRWLIVKIASSFWEQVRRLFGPGYFGRKLALVIAAAVFALFYVMTDLYRVTANAVIEGKIQRAIVAPFNGFIKEAAVRAGDTVSEGQLLMALDERDLALERLRWVTERQRKTYEYEKALGARSRAEARIAETEREEAEAQIRLVDEQLARSSQRAPFAGLVISGDLSQSIGAAVQRGQVLFEIAPLEAYRVVLDVDESQIGDIIVGARGELLVASLPHSTFPVTVEKITPVAKAEEGRNTFRVEASLQGAAPELRPGMRGVGKIEIERRRVIWIWSRSLIEWWRVWSWRWFA